MMVWARRRWMAMLLAAAAPWACQVALAGLVEVVAAAKPAVLAVGVFNATTSPRFTFRGTGFVVGDGTLLLTNLHVLPDPADTTFGNQLRVVGVNKGDRKSTRLNSSHLRLSRMPSSA